MSAGTEVFQKPVPTPTCDIDREPEPVALTADGSGNWLRVIGFLSNSKPPQNQKITGHNQNCPNNDGHRQRHKTICFCDVVSV